ncbi:Rad21/Rec8 like protein, partial [Ramicandelaber brevisporus]
MEKKLTKNQLRETSVQASVDTLTGTELPPLALRLTGQLLLGVVVIYSRKARYLLDDCNDAVLRLKITFRPAVVDAPEMNITADLAAITM